MTVIHPVPALSPIAEIWREFDRRFAETDAERLTMPWRSLDERGIAPRDLRCGYREGDTFVVERGGFYQSAGLWTNHSPAFHLGTEPVPGPDGRDHPRRPTKPEGIFYDRFDRDAGGRVSFEVLEIDRHLGLFHKWQNDPRVAHFWEEDKSEAELAEYLAIRIANPSVLPVVSSFDGDPTGYLEFYWGQEDRLGAYYDAHPWDRGWHGLIGERKHLGRKKTSAWIRSLNHYLFLDCPLTEKIVGEPRADNVKLLSYTEPMGYRKVREFDFPHKRAALMHCDRDVFFRKVRF
ncbi:N-acetyltransferase [Pseudohoeflea suaedae]|uniref:N-acetyltransferase n=1 Tax=Pseudohoeflea suaedae TaxID=877384 RepID=A0A4R5PN44_9HYPH|nr:GNAT family N-acetyltransferase [Pseudohoeflea suaedae]TDH38436.1 N-acetyltransferase [Pseudohoeflea suaedae]